ncbi:hypothetical protein B9W64_37945 [Streptomyces sp. CS159]|uniref:hypothetical protein n=1 Tax=Streptomyces sp. CS159 TaxID=1982762 RepID=UPI000B4134BB|nr:hypothetical protein [Streptomyces sp. CS159]OVZ99579.1 hypothetical protein B9W64_37945 [Streptomyces sp. CS159]
MPSDNDAPRVLRLTFEFHVPRGLGVNIRNQRRFSAVEALVAAVQSVAGQVFPWANRMTWRHEWSYAWWDKTEERELPTTDMNTPKK